MTTRSLDSHLDLLDRQRREKAGEFIEREFNGLIARRFPTGRLEIVYSDGEVERDLNDRSMQEIMNATTHEPELRAALDWAGWTLWPEG
ncbi:hypothetical protein [Sphingomonas nostoxanthinifaciens]|uniref:hypothetical protein n=1 Tax=Sphingomonas nostoxanthinifaciens TaxID=2872652 RepID=UPI001CC1C6E9|nr:hypothetical protein [Sphingomonas nostoxanthinifaciens]UAK25753.1 hypothetical protein K8P63_06370 [Sphingomonas nostoxanthinifaciens]